MNNNGLRDAINVFAKLNMNDWLSETESAYKTRLLILMSNHIIELEKKLNKLETDSGYISLRHEWITSMYGEPNIVQGTLYSWSFNGSFFILDKWCTSGKYYSAKYPSGIEVRNRKELIETVST